MSSERRQIHKAAIRNFAIEARKTLIKSAIAEAGLIGISKEGIKKPVQRGIDFEVYETLAGTEKRLFGSDVRRRASLVEAIRQRGFDEVIEETAYTWFNRLIAIRFMEVNNYLPFRIRVLSSDSGSLTPDIVSRSSEVDLNLSEAEHTAIQRAKDENQYDEAFRLLFVKTCNALNDILPGLFEKTDDYMELLLKLPYTSDGVVRMLVDTIPEDDFNVREGGQVEIIGWLYQYYNTEPKAKAFAKKGKITKEEIPAVTQLFTPDWIVRYMVENSLGRLWIEHLLVNGDSRTEQEIADNFGWKYYLPEAEQEPEVQVQLAQIRTERKDLTPEEIRCIDPCQGSGHILVYLYDVLMQIYREDGYSERDAARSILEYNLYGLDIDDRAYQLSYFAVLMKARQYDRMILKKHIRPHIYSIQESNTVNRTQLKYLGADMSETERNRAIKQLTGLLDTFKDAKEYGSILNVDACNWDLLRRFVKNDRIEGQMGLDIYDIEKTQIQLMTLIDIGEVMAQKYHVATTNPPYMSARGSMSGVLTNYLTRHYPLSKNDMFTVFMDLCERSLLKNGLYSMVNQQSWMFLAGFAKMRERLYEDVTFTNMIHIGAGAFEGIAGEVVQSVAFTVRNYCLSGFKCSFLDETNGKWRECLQGIPNNLKKYTMSSNEIRDIPNGIMCYHLGGAAIKQYYNGKRLDSYADPRVGMATGDNDLFVRLWQEVDYSNIGFGIASGEETALREERWYPYNKGGECRRWYGNRTHIVDWYHNGSTITSYKQGRLARGEIEKKNSECWNREYYFLKSISWSKVSSGRFAVRYYEPGFIFDVAGCSILGLGDNLFYVMGALNSELRYAYIESLSPTLNFETGAIKAFPVLIATDKKAEVEEIVKACIQIEKEEWDSFEGSWDFQKHPLINSSKLISESFEIWDQRCKDRFSQLKECEERLNELFIGIYGLGDELSSHINEKDITLRRADLVSDVKSLISYAVGCMFGRYSLDIEGLAYAGGDWKEAYTTKYKIFLPDEDAIIPITDEEYFKDDIVARFIEFVQVVYGDETLEENLKFIADALGNKGETPRTVIRNYFLNDFYKDHCNTYSVTGSGKRPIYWLFNSGKQNGFKALIYIHRYTPDTVGLIRSVYLHKAQAAIQNALQNAEYIISTTTSQTERARETKKRDKYVKQLNELRPYYQALSHIALQRIPMDLDDGVKKNYQLFQGVEISTEGKKKQTIDLLAKL